MKLRRASWALVLSALLGGCGDAAPPESGLILRFEGAEASEASPEVLVIWARYRKNGARVALAEPTTVALGGAGSLPGACPDRAVAGGVGRGADRSVRGRGG